MGIQHEKTAVIYARYSGDRQRESSIDDQVRNCQRYADREGLRVIDIYDDRAVTGAVRARAGYLQMLDHAFAGGISTLLVDDLSRFSRDDYEMKGALRRLAWQGVRVVGVTDGYDSFRKGHKIHAGFKGLMNEMHLDDLREWTHRGMTGKAQAGFSCGGRTYGYRHVPIEHATKRDPYGRPEVVAVRNEIDPAQADIVRAIYDWYAQGHSCVWIAHELNRRSVRASRGKTWACSAVKVVLENDMYAGQVAWNRKAWAKHPETGKRTYKRRPKEQWVVCDMPELRIVPEAVMEVVRLRQKARRAMRMAGETSPAQRHLFSGLLSCAECGGNFVMVGGGRYGCGNRRTRGTVICANTSTVSRAIVEGRLLQAIKEELREGVNVEKFKRSAVEVLSARQSEGRVAALRQQVKGAERRRDNLLNAIKQGILTPTTKEALEAEEEAVAVLQSEIKAIECDQVTGMLPRAVERYRDTVERLESALGSHIEPAREILRSLLGGRIVLHRHRGGYLEAEMPGGVEMMYQSAQSAGVDLRGCGGPQRTESTSAVEPADGSASFGASAGRETVWIPLLPLPQKRRKAGSGRTRAASLTACRVLKLPQ